MNRVRQRRDLIEAALEVLTKEDGSPAAPVAKGGRERGGEGRAGEAPDDQLPADGRRIHGATDIVA